MRIFLLGECSKFGGACACKPHVIGRQCSRCQSGYYGFPACQRCNCVTGSCDEVTGKCDCAPNVEERECRACLDNYFGFHPKFGCEDCECVSALTVGRSNNCHKETGQCECAANVAGRRCDKCQPGFYGYPECRECSCSRNGMWACFMYLSKRN